MREYIHLLTVYSKERQIIVTLLKLLLMGCGAFFLRCMFYKRLTVHVLYAGMGLERKELVYGFNDDGSQGIFHFHFEISSLS
jgi:hypothetical protein